MKPYAGIGGRDTPADVRAVMAAVAHRLAAEDYMLRTGHAPGADQAFEHGAMGRAEVFLPWPNYELSPRCYADVIWPLPTAAAYAVARQHHPLWAHLGRGVRALHARNAHIVLGRNLDAPVAFVLCWTRDGGDSGGTGQALRIARAHDIPVFNLHDPETFSRVSEKITSTATPESA